MTYRHKLHVPLGWRLQQHSKKGKGGGTTTTKTYLLEGLVSNAISNKTRDMAALRKRSGVILGVEERQPTQPTTVGSIIRCIIIRAGVTFTEQVLRYDKR